MEVIKGISVSWEAVNQLKAKLFYLFDVKFQTEELQSKLQSSCLPGLDPTLFTTYIVEFHGSVFVLDKNIMS